MIVVLTAKRKSKQQVKAKSQKQKQSKKRSNSTCKDVQTQTRRRQQLTKLKAVDRGKSSTSELDPQQHHVSDEPQEIPHNQSQNVSKNECDDAEGSLIWTGAEWKRRTPPKWDIPIAQQVWCQNCGKTVWTRVKRVPRNQSMWYCFHLSACCIPLCCFDSFQDIQHRCPTCDHLIGQSNATYS